MTAVAINTRAARISLLVAAVAAQFAVMPILSVRADALGLTALVVVGLVTLRLPLTKDAPGSRQSNFSLSMAPRQALALIGIIVGAVMVLYRVDAFDADSKAAALVTLLVVVQIAHLLAMQTRREAALGCAIVVVMLSVGAAFVGDVALLLPMLVALPAVAVTTALLHRASLIDGAGAVSTGGLGAIVRACVSPVAFAAAIGVLIFLVLPNSGHLKARSRFASAVSAGDVTSTRVDTSPGGRASSNPGGGAVDLSLRGALSTAAVFEVDAQTPRYWQGETFSHFDGRAWEAALPLTPWQQSPIAQAAPPDMTDPIRSAGGALQQYSVTVLTPAPFDAVVAPGRPASYAGAGVVFSDADGTAHIKNGPVAGDVYQVSSQPSPNAPDDVLRTSSGPDPAGTQWTELPHDLPARDVDLASTIAGGGRDRVDAVTAIENYVRTHETYNLNSPLPAQGVDAVDDFLFVSHQGFCEQFATATVVLLRSLGIPARFVTGYVGGDTTTTPGKRVFRGSDAHAWVQVYYPGVGWVDSDPTAGSVLHNALPSLRQRLSNTLKRWWQAVPHGRLGALVIVIVLLGIGLAIAAAGRRVARHRRRFADVDRGLAGDGPVLAAYLQLDRALRGVERARGPSESFGEFARRLGGVVASPAEVAAAIACLERESYGLRRPSSSESRRAVEVFDRLRLAAGSQPIAVLASTP